MLQTLGAEITEILFYSADTLNKIRLTQKEMSLLFAFVLSICEPYAVSDYNLVKQINEQFKQSLLREFCMNKRDFYFIRNLSKVRS
jgi:hypothetical protein